MATYRIWCDSCSPMAINGVPCHEEGCPRDRDEWVRAFGYVRPEGADLPEEFKDRRRKNKDEETEE